MNVFDCACNCWIDGVWACGFGVVGSGRWFRSADACSGLDHLFQFGYLGGSTKNSRLAMHLIWLSCVWVIYNKRNGLIFKHDEYSLNHILWWLKTKNTTFFFLPVIILGGFIMLCACI